MAPAVRLSASPVPAGPPLHQTPLNQQQSTTTSNADNQSDLIAKKDVDEIIEYIEGNKNIVNDKKRQKKERQKQQRLEELRIKQVRKCGVIYII